jgi:hypothetical protein
LNRVIGTESNPRDVILTNFRRKLGPASIEGFKSEWFILAVSNDGPEISLDESLL